MKSFISLASFGFVLAVGFSVAVTENEFADIADEFEAEKPRGEEYMTENGGEFDDEDLEDDDKAISRRDMVTEDEEFDQGAFYNDDDRDEVSDEDEVGVIEKSADPFRFRRRFGRLRRPRRLRRFRRRIRIRPRFRRRFRG